VLCCRRCLLVAAAATKLVCSLGPSSHTVEMLEEMLRVGMVAARIDLTWGGLDFHRATLAALNVSRRVCMRSHDQRQHSGPCVLVVGGGRRGKERSMGITVWQQQHTGGDGLEVQQCTQVEAMLAAEVPHLHV
jgi:hypothetical protein